MNLRPVEKLIAVITYIPITIWMLLKLSLLPWNKKTQIFCNNSLCVIFYIYGRLQEVKSCTFTFCGGKSIWGIFPNDADFYHPFKVKQVFCEDTKLISHRKGRFIVVGNIVSLPISQKEKNLKGKKLEVNQTFLSINLTFPIRRSSLMR